MTDEVYRIRSTRPLIWRTPHSLQVGIDPPQIRVDDIPDTAAPLIHALRDGVSDEGLGMLAERLKVSASTVKSIVQTLSPSFDQPESTAAHSVTVTGHSTATQIISSVFDTWGFDAVHRDEPAPHTPGATVVLAGDYVANPRWSAALSHTSTPHVPVIFSDLSITVGPLVTPGTTPCLSCHELWRRDEEPEWLSIGSQLWDTPAPTATLHGAQRAVALCAMLLGELGTDGIDLPPSGVQLEMRPGSRTSSRREITFHPECRCRGL